jgi:hypothetical protein
MCPVFALPKLKPSPKKSRPTFSSPRIARATAPVARD